MPRWAKWMLIGAVVVATALGIASWLVVRALDPARLTAIAATQVRAATGRTLSIDGKVDVRIFPPAVVADGLRFGNASWGSRPDMIRVRHAELRVAFWPLLHGRVRVRNLRLAGSDVLLETGPDSEDNWTFRGEGPSNGESQGLPEIALDAVRIEDAKIAYRDRGREISLAVSALTLRSRADNDQVELAASLRGQRFTIQGTTGRIESLLAGATALPVDLAFATDGASATAKGTLAYGAPSAPLELAVRLDVTDPAALSRLAGVGAALPVPLGVSAKLRRDGAKTLVDPFRVAIDKQVVTGRATLKSVGRRPSIDASVNAASLDLSSLSPPAATQQGAPRRFLFSEAPLHFALPALDAAADVRIGQLILPDGLEAGSVRARVELKGDRLELKPLAFTLAGGTVNGDATLLAQPGKPARITLNVDAKAISLEKAAAAMGRGGQISGGRTDVAIGLAGAGNSLHELVAGASGQVRIVVGPARLSDNLLDVGGDALNQLADALDPFHKADRATELACAVARLPLRSGRIAVERSIAYETSKVNMAVAGTIDLRDESLDLAVRPTIKQGLSLDAGNLAELVRITGTLRNPTIAPDTLSVAKKALSLYAAIATTGASLLAEKALNGRPDPHPCQTALAAGSGKSGKASATKERRKKR